MLVVTKHNNKQGSLNYEDGIDCFYVGGDSIKYLQIWISFNANICNDNLDFGKACAFNLAIGEGGTARGRNG
jgi:hypothetical protein